MDAKQKGCAVCGEKSANRCSGCNQVYYCCKEHQKNHWKIHKKECAKMNQQKSEEEKKSVELECTVCGISESSARIKLCASCQMVGYCNEEHQLQDWRFGSQGGHRNICVKLKGIRQMMAPILIKTAKGNRKFRSDSRVQLLAQSLVDTQHTKRQWLRTAVELTRLLAEGGDKWGQYFHGYNYKTGVGMKADAEMAVSWYRKSADQGHEMARASLGNAYGSGEGVKRDMSEAIKLTRQSARAGDPAVQNSLGTALLMGGDGVQKDPKEAAYWFKKAGDGGFVGAYSNLAQCYEKGEGVPQDLKKAVLYYRKAADLGLKEAQVNLGTLFSRKDIRDMNEAAKWFRKAADQGQAHAQTCLGKCYLSGEGVPEDPSEALKWFRKAADQKDAEAQFQVGLIHFYGHGVPKDRSEGVKWFQSAADQGNAEAQYFLGLCYSQGTGVPKNEDKGRRLFKMAKDNNVNEELMKILAPKKMKE